MRLARTFGNACQFGVDRFRRNVDAAGIVLLHGLLPKQLCSNLRAQRRHRNAAMRQHAFELVHRHVVVGEDALNSLVDLDRRHCDIVAPRFLDLKFLGLKLFENLFADFFHHLRRIRNISRAHHQRHALAKLISGDRLVVDDGNNAVLVVLVHLDGRRRRGGRDRRGLSSPGR